MGCRMHVKGRIGSGYVAAGIVNDGNNDIASAVILERHVQRNFVPVIDVVVVENNILWITNRKRRLIIFMYFCAL